MSGVASPSATVSLNRTGLVIHPRPFLSNGGGSVGGRCKNYKGTFGRFTYETDENDSGNPYQQSTPPPKRPIDQRGAPTEVHRGVTGLRARTTEQGIPGSTGPIGNTNMSFSKDFEWQPSFFQEGGMKVGDNFRHRSEGLEGVKRRTGEIQRLHGSNIPFTHGANSYHEYFDPTIRSNARNFSKTLEIHGSEASAKVRVPHRTPFRGGGLSQTSVTQNRGFIGGHPQYQYHFSEYGLSEKTLSDTKIANGIGTGFRMQCGHQIHHPMKRTTIRSSKPCETDRNPNYHSIQSKDETCYHKCNEVLQQARYHNYQQQQQQHQQHPHLHQQAPPQPAFTSRF